MPVNTAVPTCFVVYGEGGSASANTADIIGVWGTARITRGEFIRVHFLNPVEH